MSFSELQCAFLHFCHTNKISLIREVLPQSVAPRGLLHTSRHFVVVVVVLILVTVVLIPVILAAQDMDRGHSIKVTNTVFPTSSP